MSVVAPAATLAALAAGIAFSAAAGARCAHRISPFAAPACAIYVAAMSISMTTANASFDPMAQIRIGLIVAATAVAAITDMQTGLIYDAAVLPALVAVLATGALEGQPMAHLAGAGAGFAALGSLYVVTRGRGIGLGDLKLGACMGAALGAAAGVAAIGVAFIAGGFAAAVLLASGRANRRTEVRFAPYLALGTGWIVLWPLR